MKKIIFILAITAFIVGIANFINKNYTTKHVTFKPTITESEARLIAEKSCIKGGEALNAGVYDTDSKSWRFEANFNATREGCQSYCSVSADTKQAEVIWKCVETSTTPTREETADTNCTDDQRKSDFCTKIYKPVCGLVEIQCIKAPCNPIRETFGNSCVACSNKLVKSYKESACIVPKE